jgi:molybdopterin-biosynthesis enzyme MoeA-like protein
MIKIPKQTIPLKNSVGAAPGVKFPKEITNQYTEIFSLPGVPPELKAIFNEEILPEILACAKDHKFTQAKMVIEEVGESNLSAFINSIRGTYPEIWIKTHPHFRLDKETGNRQYFVELHLTSFDCNNEKIIDIMDELLNKIEDDVLKIGGTIISKEKSTQTKIV